MEGLRGDLARLGAEFTQLSEFDAVRLGRSRVGDPPGATRLLLSYSRGLLGSLEVEEPEFEEDGCHISVEIILYHPGKNSDVEDDLVLSTRGYGFYELDDGSIVAMRDLVVAEANDRGTAFTRQARRLVNNRLIRLSLELDGVIIDPGE